MTRHLERRGFTAHRPGRLPYPAQVALFQGAWSVFGVLGSDLAGLLHAPGGVAVTAAAPDSFGDDFFHALVTDRHGTLADLRGPAEGEAPHPHRLSFRLDLALLDRALDLDGG